eukprot:gene6459-7123_t
MSTQSFLDAEGNINTARLAKELEAALEFDTRYRQTDNMKKRAVKVAASYDEFKAMVACAHLKKLTKKEVESLSNVKKGWKKHSHVSQQSGTQLLELEQTREETMRKHEAFVEKVKAKKGKPRSAMELERDLRRINSDEGKMRYLEELGLGEVRDILNRGADVDLLEVIALAVVTVHEQRSSNVDDSTTAVSDGEVNSCTNWLTMLSSLSKFSLMLDFADRSLATKIRDSLQSLNPATTPEKSHEEGK